MQPPKRLYKFVPSARVDILRDLCVRFTQPDALNDPFELSPMFDRLMSDGAMEHMLEQSKVLIEAALRNHYEKLSVEQKSNLSIDMVLSFVRENPGIVDQAVAEIAPEFRSAIIGFSTKAKAMLAQAIKSKVGVLSLSESVNNLLLWSYYADSHKGIVIEFDARHAFFDRRRSEKDELYHLRRVKYEKRSSLGRSLLDLDGGDLLLTKSLDWSHECEWRMLASLEAAASSKVVGGETIYLFAIPPSAITGVILGARISDELEKNILAILRSENFSHVRLYKSELDMDKQLVVVKGCDAVRSEI